MAKATAQAKEPIQKDLLEEVDPKTNTEQTENEELQANEAGEVEVKLDEEIEEVEDPSIALQKQVDALRKSEEIQKGRAEKYRQEAEEARRAVQQSANEVGKSRKEILQSQFDAVSTALAASQSEAESAKRDMRAAANAQDIEAQIEATERLTRAQANIAKLEDGKIEIESRLKAPEPEQPQQQNPMPARIQRWIQKNPGIFSDQRKFDKVKAYHWVLEDDGVPFDSDEYIEKMEVHIGLRQPEPETEEEEVVPAPKPKTPASKTPIVSAPVSREGPSSADGSRNGEIKLTALEVEAAKIAGVTTKVYAENLAKIRKMKANGTYGGQQ